LWPRACLCQPSLVSTYRSFGGTYPVTATLTNVLAAKQIIAPHTGKPFSEAMILGISGGLGMGYILWEFQEHRLEHNIKVLVLAFQNTWQYPIKYYEATCRRLGLKFTIPETGNRKVATQTLHDALARSTPVVVWVDGASMPYLQLPEGMKGHAWHFVVACGTDGDDVLIDDLATQPFRVPAEVLAEARARIASSKNRLLVVEGAAKEIDLEGAITKGIAFCAEHLSADSESFSLPALRKWARLMTDQKNKKGWPVVFKDRRGLYSALSSLFEAIELQGAPGGLRGMYSDFLLEAASVVNNPRLKEPAEHYAALAKHWHALAEEALPDTVPQFKRAKQVLRDRRNALLKGGEAWRTTQPLTEELRALRSACNLNFPLDDQAIAALFSTLQTRLQAIYQAEVEAIKSLKASSSARRGSSTSKRKTSA
jgi:hypothetical protein